MPAGAEKVEAGALETQGQSMRTAEHGQGACLGLEGLTALP